MYGINYSSRFSILLPHTLHKHESLSCRYVWILNVNKTLNYFFCTIILFLLHELLFQVMCFNVKETTYNVEMRKRYRKRFARMKYKRGFSSTYWQSIIQIAHENRKKKRLWGVARYGSFRIWNLKDALSRKQLVQSQKYCHPAQTLWNLFLYLILLMEI